MATPTTTPIAVHVTDVDEVGGSAPGVKVTFSYVNTNGATAAGSTNCTSTQTLTEVALRNDLKLQMAKAINADQATYTCEPSDIVLVTGTGAL